MVETGKYLFTTAQYILKTYVPPPKLAVGHLVCWSSVSVNLIISHGLVGFPALIARITLYGVDNAVLHLLHDTDMVA